MPTGPRSSSPSRALQSARAVALVALVESVKSEEGVDILLDRSLKLCSFDSRDRGLAVELTFGVLRRLGTIDWRLEPVLDKPLPRLPLIVQMLLRLGAYQILFLDRIPQSAAVNESVQLARTYERVLGRDWSGFVNAVLRQLIREPVPPWPSMDTHAAKALAVRYSVPEWMSQRWIDRLGAAMAERICEEASEIPPVTLRVNRTKTGRDEFLARLQQAGIAARPTSVSPVGIVIENAGPIPALPGFEEGLFYVEDEAAQLIPPLLDPQPGDVILDACAAPGGKSTHMAELLHDRGAIYAIDRKGARLDLLRQNCVRLGIQSVLPITGDVRHPSEWIRAVEAAAQGGHDRRTFFDRILEDAPCSGLGVLRRHPEAKWRKECQAFSRHHTLQLQILESVAPRLRPGGVLVYSTCSTEPEENETVIEQFLSTHAEFRRESVAPWLPPEARSFVTEQGDLLTMGNRLSMDGFYAARLTKVE
jgi:16S rRNA (cytosine967-C5)-methyltransferase